MNHNLLILGAGQYGQQVRDIALAEGRFGKIDFLDDAGSLAIDTLQAAEKYVKDYRYAVVAMGNPELRLRYLDMLAELGYEIPVIRHPSAVILQSSEVACGCIIEPLAVINANVKVGRGCLISAGAVINHNASLEEGCHIDCNAVVAARCAVKKGIKVPSGAVYG